MERATLISVKNRYLFTWTSPLARLCIPTHCPHSASILVPCIQMLPASPAPTPAQAYANEFLSWSHWHYTFHIQSHTQPFQNRGSLNLVSQTCNMRKCKWKEVLANLGTEQVSRAQSLAPLSLGSFCALTEP